MKTKIFFLFGIMVVSSLSVRSQSYEIRIDEKSENTPFTYSTRSDQQFYFVNTTDKNVNLHCCDTVLMKPHDTLFMKYDAIQQELIFPKIQSGCKISDVRWSFENETVKKIAFRIDFSPDQEDQPQISKISFLPSCIPDAKNRNIMVNGLDNNGASMVCYHIIFDVADGKISYLDKNGENDGIKRIRPVVGKDVRVVIENYNPYTDSVGLSYSFVNNNLEQGEQFAGLVSGFKQDDKVVSAVPKNEPKAQGTGNMADILGIFAHEMESFYREMIGRSSIDTKSLSAYIDEININIRLIFGVSTVNPDTIRKSLGLVIKELEPKELRDKCWKDLEMGLNYYQKIITYNISNLMPIQVTNTDDLVLDFSVYKNKNRVDSRTYRYYNKGGFKMDFSAGIFGTSLVDHRYTSSVVPCYDTVFGYGNSGFKDSIITIDTVNRNKIIRDDFGKFSVGIGLLAHFYIRTNPWFNVALNTGFIIDNTISTKYLFGISFLLGHETRFNINVGGVVGQVKRLASGLEEGQFYDTGSGQVQTIPTKDVWKCGWYVGVTYNFGSITPKKKTSE